MTSLHLHAADWTASWHFTPMSEPGWDWHWTHFRLNHWRGFHFELHHALHKLVCTHTAQALNSHSGALSAQPLHKRIMDETKPQPLTRVYKQLEGADDLDYRCSIWRINLAPFSAVLLRGGHTGHGTHFTHVTCYAWKFWMALHTPLHHTAPHCTGTIHFLYSLRVFQDGTICTQHIHGLHSQVASVGRH